MIYPGARFRRVVAIALGFATFLAATTAVAQAEEPSQRPPGQSQEYGTNVALASAGAIATASGQEVPDRFGPELAIDGIADSDASRWSGEYADDSWFQVRLAQRYMIDHVSIRWSTSCPVKYRLEVSNDGVNWTDVSGVLMPTECRTWETRDLSSLDEPYQYVRMQGIERRITQGFPYGYSINEFEVWDGPEPPPPPTFPVTPRPASYEVEQHVPPFVLRPGSRIVAQGPAAAAVQPFAQRLRASTGYPLPLVASNPRAGDIQILVDPHAEISVPGAVPGSPERYRLTVRTNMITVTAATSVGAFYGVQSLRQLFPTFVESPTRLSVPWVVPCATIADAPRFAYRGLMLDLARNFLSVEQIESFIDTMSEFKMNVLHLHLADDQGWRIQITNEGRAPGDDIDYTLLTSVSGGTAIMAGGPQAIPGRSGFLTQQDYRSIVEYAAAHHVMVIPELDMPGHTNAILHAIPQLNTSGSVPQPPLGEDTVPADSSYRVGHTSLDTRAEVTYTFLAHVIGQLAAMTPGPYLHVGGDEAASTSHDDYVYFMNRVTGIVHDAGKRTMGWNQYADANLQAGDLIQYYNLSTAGTIQAVRDKGARVVMSWYPNTYLDYTYAQGDIYTYYGWDPAKIIGGLPEAAISGVEAPLWTENVRSDDEAEYQVFPRAIATAEVGWTLQDQRSEPDFAKRLALLGGRLTLQQVNFYPSPLAPWRTEVAGTNHLVHGTATGDLDLGVVLAPGTTPSALSVSVDWGDGTPPAPAQVVVAQEPDIVHGVGAYWIRGSHRYDHPGGYRASIEVSGTGESVVAPFVVQVRPD